MSKIDQIKRQLRRKKKPDSRQDHHNKLSTGSTLLDMACSGDMRGGFLKGKYYLIVGDSSSGKTFVSLTCFAEAVKNPAFDNYRLIYDNGEDGALMDIAKFFGRGVAERLEPPATVNGAPAYSETIEEFYYNLDDARKDGRPFIYVLDSMDSLSSTSEADKFQKQKIAYRKRRKEAGSYGDGKAKANSANLRQFISYLTKSGSILIIICQTRDSLGFGFDTKTRSGGRSLRFYACLEIWLSIAKTIKRRVRGKERPVGVLSKMRVRKNRLTGRDRTVEVPIYYDIGLDDIGSCVDFLVDEGHWSEKKGMISNDFTEEAVGRDELIAHIETEGLEKQLKLIVSELWHTIEDELSLKRKPRYE